MKRPLRVAVFNDSPTMRLAIRAALTSPDVQIVLERPDGRDAAEAIARSRPDVVVMDVMMPSVGGYEATREIMARTPVPIVMISSVVDPHDRDVILAALTAGALHIAEPPPIPGEPDYDLQRAAFVELLHTVAGARLRARPSPALAAPRAPGQDADIALDVIGVVASAGGPQALQALLSTLPPRVLPPMLLVQHIARGFVGSFAAWLREAVAYPVDLAVGGARAQRGRLYVAPDDHHLWLAPSGELVLDPRCAGERFCPSGDVLLTRLGKAHGSRAAAVILSGMGDDGTEGARVLRSAGGAVVAQADPLIDGMPQVAWSKGAVDDRLPVAAISDWLCHRSGLT